MELIKPLKKYLQSSFVRLEEIVNRDSALKKEVSVFNIEQEYYYSDMVPIFRMEAQNFVKARKEIAKVCLQQECSLENIMVKKQLFLLEKFKQLL